MRHRPNAPRRFNMQHHFKAQRHFKAQHHFNVRCSRTAARRWSSPRTTFQHRTIAGNFEPRGCGPTTSARPPIATGATGSRRSPWRSMTRPNCSVEGMAGGSRLAGSWSSRAARIGWCDGQWWTVEPTARPVGSTGSCSSPVGHRRSPAMQSASTGGDRPQQRHSSSSTTRPSSVAVPTVPAVPVRLDPTATATATKRVAVGSLQRLASHCHPVCGGSTPAPVGL